jgi:predicted enzyme related to lactoylglutathione lyase
MTPLDPRSLCQIEIPVSDQQRALAFYRAAFGWEAVPAEIHEFVVLAVPDDCPFGLALVPYVRSGGEPVPRNGPVLYFATPDPEAVVARVEAAGGRRRFGPTKLAGYGTIFQIEDPDGNRFGLYHKIGPA